MAELERIYTVPLRNAYFNAPRTNRAKRAVREVKIFMARHMKTEEEKVWIDNPVLSDLGLKVGRIAGKFNAAGNNVLCNDHGALVNPDLSKTAEKTVEDV